MHIDEELYYMALAKEDEYLDLINLRHPDKHYGTLKEALTDYFNMPNRKNYDYKEGIDKDAAIAMVRSVEKNNSSLNAFLNNQLSKFISKEIGQIQGVKTTEDNYEKRIAGYLDEVNAVDLLKHAFPWQDSITEVKTKNDKTSFEEYTYTARLEYKGESSGDFKLKISAKGSQSSPASIYKPADINKSGELNFENKLKLDCFHIADGNIKLGDAGISNLEKEYLDLMWEGDEKHITGNLDYDIPGEFSGARDYNKYMTYIRLDTFNQVLANYIMYKKLSTTLPIFISPSPRGIKFKLCSEVVAEVGKGNFTLKSGLKKGTFTTTNLKDFKKTLISQAIEQVGKYQLWYGKK